MKHIEKVETVFWGDHGGPKPRAQSKAQFTSVNPFDILNQEEKMDAQIQTNHQVYTSSFEFMSGEYLIGDIIISPFLNTVRETDAFENKEFYYSQPKDNIVGFIRFQTSFGRTFEAGSIKQLSLDDKYVFDADKSFMAGLFGFSSVTEDKIISLGFILTEKIQAEYFDNLKWTDDAIPVILNKQEGETRQYCNNKEKTRPFYIKYA